MDFASILTNAASFLLSYQMVAYALAALGLAVHFGFAGLLNFGVAAFMAIGGYGYAIATLSFGLPWIPAMLVGLLCCVVFALILGIPTLRLRADYLAIVTIAAAEIVRYLLLTEAFKEWTNSSSGLAGYAKGEGRFESSTPFPALPPGERYGFGPWRYSNTELWVIVFGLILLLLCIAFVALIMRSPWGRVLKGIREDEDAVRSLGKNVFAYKMQALVIGAVICGIGGIIYILPTATTPDAYGTQMTFSVWTILLLGGAATVLGPWLGALLYWFLSSLVYGLLTGMAKADILPISEAQSQVLVQVLIGVSLMLIVIFRPQGILGNKREMTFVK